VAEKIGYHMLRHTYATVLKQVGVRMKVAKPLRHRIFRRPSTFTLEQWRDKPQAVELVAEQMLKGLLTGHTASGPETVN
jgi:integrase